MANQKKLDLMVGPFAEVLERLDDFTSSLYLQKLYNDTIDELLETQMAYDLAVEQKDDKRADSLAKQIEFLENVVSLANNNVISFQKGETLYD